MTENYRKFIEKVSNDENLKKIFEDSTINEKNYKEKITAVAKQAGFDLSDKDFEEETVEISKDEMATITGAGGCGCIFGGGGGGSELYCTCVIRGKGAVKGYEGISGQGGCICYGGGVGATNRH